MKPATISELKKEMKSLSREELMELCIRLARYKKENKELLSYLIFSGGLPDLSKPGDEAHYVSAVKQEVEQEFQQINKSTLYFAKKTIRRILRLVKKHIKYSGKKQTEVELLLFFCQQLRKTGIPLKESKALMNLYQRQVTTIEKSLAVLHEDLQFDYREAVASLKW